MNRFDIVPSKGEGEPLYMQIYIRIVSLIKGGAIGSGERLPSKRALASDLGVSVNTVDAAYQMLVAEGYAQARERSGVYVCELSQLDMAAKLPQRIEQEKRQEESFRYDLKTGSIDTTLFPYKTWGRIQRDILFSNPELLNHGESSGDLPLRRAIARYLHEYRGVVCSEEQIIVGAGIEYLVSLLADILFERIFALENPGYTRIFNILANNRVSCRFAQVDEGGLSVDSLCRLGAEVVYVTPSHQFPTGAVMPMSRRTRLLSWASESEGRWVIEDDYDSEFRFDIRPIPSLQGIDTAGKVIYLSTFSRCIAPSVRIAYMVLPPAMLKLYRERFSDYSSTVSRFEQHTLSTFINDGHFSRHLNRLRIAYRERRDILVDTLFGMMGRDGIDITGAHTGLHLLVRVKNGMSEGELVSRARRLGIRIGGLSSFYIEDAQTCPQATVVVGYSAIKKDQIAQVCRLLAEAWGFAENRDTERASTKQH